MKVLVSAYACETGRGSEGEISWRLVHRLAEEHEVWVITRANLRPIHDLKFAAEPKPEKLNFIYFDLPWIFRFYKRGKRLFLLYYYIWQIGVGLKARQIVKANEFDVLHHLIGGMDWMPAGLALAPGRFIWGSVGSEDTHPLMRQRLSVGAWLKDCVRVSIRWLMRTFDPLVRFSAARAEVILSHTPETLPRRYALKLRPFIQTGIENSPTLAHRKKDLARGETLRLIFAGELKEWKGAHLALEAALRLFETEPAAELTVVGDGPLREVMEATSRAHPHGGRVHFRGRVPMEELIEVLHGGDVFLYPSFHHGLATVVLQAMLTGLPVVCIEGDAIGRAVGQKAGITVALSPDRDPVAGLAAALCSLAADEPRRRVLAQAAREIACTRYSYERLAQAISDIYAEADSAISINQKNKNDE